MAHLGQIAHVESDLNAERPERYREGLAIRGGGKTNSAHRFPTGNDAPLRQQFHDNIRSLGALPDIYQHHHIKFHNGITRPLRHPATI